MMKGSSAAWWFRVKRKAEDMNDTMNVFVTSAEDGTSQLLQVRLNDDVFEQLEAQLGGRLISVHLGDHQEITKGSTFEGENIDDDCTLKVVYEARETEELRAFIVDALGRRLDDVPLGTAEDIADDLVKRYPSFDSIFDPTDSIMHLEGWNFLESTLHLHDVNEPDRDAFRDMLENEGIRRGIQIPRFSYEEIRQQQQFIRQSQRGPA